MNTNKAFIKSIVKGTVLTIGTLVLAKAISRAAGDFQLQNKVALITGGSRGLGLILARQLSDAGARVIICGRDEKKLQQAILDLASRSSETLAIPCDITNKRQVKRMLRQIEEEMGPVDILINNAGTIQFGPMETMADEDYKEALDIYFWGPYMLIRNVLPGMKKRKSGRIVNIVSIGGRVSFPHLLPYNTGKHALSGFSEGLAAELKRYHIGVTTVYPGLMRTGSPKNIDVRGRHEKEYAWFKLMDSLPLLSMNADRAARQIIQAIKHGRKTIILSAPAKLATAVHGIAPGLIDTLFGLVSLMLPDMSATGAAKVTRKGHESNSPLTSSFLTRLTDKAAVQNLE